jgi:hypothetical protein
MIMFSMGKKRRLQQNIPNIPSPTFQHVSSVVIFSPWLAWPNRQENGGQICTEHGHVHVENITEDSVLP